MVLLHRALPPHFRHNPAHTHPHKSLRLPNIHPLPVYAATSPSTRVRLPRLRAPRQRDLYLDERQFRQLPRRNAFDAFWLCICHWLHHGVAFWYLQKNARERRDEEGLGRKALLLLSWPGIPKYDPSHYRRNCESLLDGCINGHGRGWCCLPVQWHPPHITAPGGSTTMAAEVGETNPKHGGEVSAKRWTIVISILTHRLLQTVRA